MVDRRGAQDEDFPRPRKQSELTRRLAELEGFSSPDPRREQVATPAEEASALLWEALGRGDLQGRRVVDLGCGPGRLAIGASWLGAASVVGIEADPGALEVARANGRRAGVLVDWRLVELGRGALELEADTVLTNPPFGAQQRGADRPFLEAAVAVLAPGSRGAIYLFSNASSQAFIERWSLAQHLQIEERRRSLWPLPPTFPHHREARGRVAVDRWVLRKEGDPP